MLCLPCRFINGLKAMKAEVKDARVVFYGAGSSAVGVAQMIATLLQTEGGLSEEEARKVRQRGLTTRECVCVVFLKDKMAPCQLSWVKALSAPAHAWLSPAGPSTLQAGLATQALSV